MPAHVAPMLARPGALPRDDDGWAYRGQVGRRARDRLLRARAAAPATAATCKTSPPRYPELARLNRALARTARSSTARSSPSTSDGRPELRALQQRMHLPPSAQVRRLAEELARDLRDLRPAVARRPLADGPAATRSAARGCGSWGSTASAGRRPTTCVGHGARAAGRDRGAGARGHRRQAPATRPTSPGRRCGEWMKVKNVQRQELVDRRLAAGRGPARRTGSARCWSACTTTDGALRYAGRVGTGFTEDELDRLAGAARAAASATTRRSRPAGAAAGRRLRRAAARRRGRVPRVDPGRASCAHPSYKGLRDDKPRRSSCASERRPASRRPRVERPRA